MKCTSEDVAPEGDGTVEPGRWEAQTVQSAEVRHGRVPLRNACWMNNREVVEEPRLVVEVVVAVDEMGRELIAIEILGVAVGVRNLEPRVAKKLTVPM